MPTQSDTDFLAGKALEGMNALSAKITTMAPMIWQKMVLLTQAESIAYLAVGGICLVAALIATTFFARIKGDSYDWPMAKIVAFVGMITYLPAAIMLLYPWNWVGAFAPEARLIARLMGAITGASA